ncbi:MAG: AAC(3) family N-acetyltransferase [Candidatus Lokiarchaeota archaeon]|nr:AAC(3) family N-acetyltransferase [Candidatus Lokiarchaeota archaeon]
MSYVDKEFDTVKNTIKPNSVNSFKKDFFSMGLKEGCVIIVHSSLSKMGWTVGGQVAVIDALMDVITPKGTLVMPTFTSGNTEPSKWQYPPVPEEWWSTIRKCIPAFHPDKIPTRGMGSISETFRKYPNVIRSNHPTTSFAAWGKYAKKIVKNHPLENDLGIDSPLGKIYKLNGQVLLLGVPHLNNSSLHLAEYLCEYPGKKYINIGSAIYVNKKRRWVTWKELDNISDDFDDLGRDYEQSINYRPKKVGQADARLLSQRDMVNFAINWIMKNRKDD